MSLEEEKAAVDLVVDKIETINVEKKPKDSNGPRSKMNPGKPGAVCTKEFGYKGNCIRIRID